MSSTANLQHAPTEARQNETQQNAQLLSPRQASGENQLLDHRAATTTQRRLQEASNHSQQSQRLQSFQRLAQTSTQARQLHSTSDKLETTTIQNKAKAETETEKANNTGLPDSLKSGIESLSGISMDHVKVHYNSDRPAQLSAHAFAQGNEIHLAPGQEQHLPHEAWHVVQQAQGRVQPTMQMKTGVSINDDAGLEKEADVMGARALQMHDAETNKMRPLTHASTAPHQMTEVVQGAGLKLLKDFDGTPLGEPDLPALYGLMQDISAWGAIDPETERIDHILTIFHRLSGGWKTGLSDVLTPILKKHGEETKTPASQVEYGAVGSYESGGLARGSWMKATLLTTNPGSNKGSDATGSRWGVYVEGHLLNHLLHGPAEEKNFAPFSRELNGLHSANVEDPLKKMIYNEARYFYYEVRVNPEAGNHESTFIPDYITCKIIELDKKDTAQALEGGYQLNAKLTNGPGASFTGSPTGKAPGEHDKLELVSGQDSGYTTELEEQFNALSIPWTPEYGAVIRDVLESAYDAISKYQQSRGKVPQSGLPERTLYLPKTNVEFGATETITSSADEDLSYEVATSMTAFPLTMRPGNTSGSEPESDNNWSPYLKGHLLNHHLHGPANEENLTPMTYSLNQQFERDVEKPLKEAVMEDGGVYSYRVSMYDTPSLDSNEPFSEEDSFFPASLYYIAYSYKPTSGKSGKDLEKIENWTKHKKFKEGTLYNTGSARVSPEDDSF